MPQAKDFDGGFRWNKDLQETNARPEGAAPETRDRPHRELERLLGNLVRGDRHACRDQIRDAVAEHGSALAVLENLLWPACAAIDGWVRRDQIGAVHQHCATALLSHLVQQLELALPRRATRSTRVLLSSGPSPLEELAAEIFAGIADADGFEVVFLGGGVESDDLFEAIGTRRPDFVLSYAASGQDAARLRRLLGALKNQPPVPGLRVGVGGGVFSRAPGLAEELGIDLSGDSPFDLLTALRQAVASPPQAPTRARAA